MQILDTRNLLALLDNDETALASVMQAYIGSAQSILDELELHCERGNRNGAGDCAHKLKSAARSIGASTLGQYCALLEKEAQLDADLQTLKHKIVVHSEEVKNYILENYHC